MQKKLIFLSAAAITCLATLFACLPPEERQTITISAALPEGGDYKLLLVETSRNEAVIAPAYQGEASASVPEGDYAVAIIDENNSPIGLLIQSLKSSFRLFADTDLGELEVDDNSSVVTSGAALGGSGRIAAADTDIDLTDLTMVDTGAPAEGNGVELEGILQDGQGDADGDLVPDFLDNDNNGNGVFDNNEASGFSISRIDAAPGDSYYAEMLKTANFIVFDNLKLQATELLAGSGGGLTPFTGRHVVTIQMNVPPALAAAGIIDSVAAASVPVFADGTVVENSGGFNLTGYPASATSWAGTGYALYPGSSNGFDLYTVWIEPRSGLVPVPSTFEFTVTLTTGTVGYFYSRLFYVFNTPPLVTEVADDAGMSHAIVYPLAEGDRGTFSAPIAISAGATKLTITADRPLDVVGGHAICGMQYQVHMFYYDASHMPVNDLSIKTTPAADAPPCTSPLSITLDLATYLPTTYTDASGMTQAIEMYQIDFTATGANGDNAAEILYFSRQ